MTYTYIDDKGTFRLKNPENSSYLYFPIASADGLKSSVTPLLIFGALLTACLGVQPG